VYRNCSKIFQCQAIVVGFLASVAAVILGWIPDGHFDVNHALILCTSSVVTASIASFVLGERLIQHYITSFHTMRLNSLSNFNIFLSLQFCRSYNDPSYCDVTTLSNKSG